MNTIKKAATLSIATAIITLLLKFIAYYITGSIGLLSDAFESFINVGSGLMLFLVLAIASKPADADHNYGHEKAEYFAAGVEGSLIIAAAITIIYVAGKRLFYPASITQIIPGVAVAAIAGIINLITAKVLLVLSGKYDSVALEANAKHIIADVWTTVCVFIGLMVIYYAPPAWQIIDPIIAILIAVHIIITGIKLLRRAVNGLMDVTLPPEDLQIINSAIAAKLPDIGQITELRSRKSGPIRFVEFNLLLPGNLSVSESHKICDNIEDEIKNHFNKASITIHVEPF